MHFSPLSGHKCGNWARELWQKRIETKSYRECIVRKIKGFITEFNLLFICKNATVVGKCIPWSFWIIKSRDFHRGVDCPDYLLPGTNGAFEKTGTGKTENSSRISYRWGHSFFCIFVSISNIGWQINLATKLQCQVHS